MGADLEFKSWAYIKVLIPKFCKRRTTASTSIPVARERVSGSGSGRSC